MTLKKASQPSNLHGVIERRYQRNAEGLLAQLLDADPLSRRWAARDLAAWPETVPQLCARLLVEMDASVRAVLFTSIARVGNTAAVDGLLPLLRSEDAALRNGAIEVLSGLPEAVAPRIEALLVDADSDVRIFTLNLLGDLPHPNVPRWLATVLRSEREPNVIGAALEILAEIGDAELAEPLREVRARFADQPYITFAADLALKRMEVV